jgi:predicted NBD/HSP70 family sugar kinase
MGIIVGLDIGGTKIVAAAADLNGKIIRRCQRATPVGLSEGLALILDLIAEVADKEKILAMGAAIGGPLDWEGGIVSPLHQPEWRDIPLKQILQERWDCPFFVDVDTNVAAIGEYDQNQLSSSTFIYLTISTGMGGGIIKDGKIYRGGNGAHPEIAHQSIHWKCSHPERMQCECGLPDCLEGLISGNGIRRIYQKKAEQLSAPEWEEVCWNLGQGLRNIATCYAPDEISIGGGVALGGAVQLFPQAVEIMAQYLKLVPAPKVYLSPFGYDSPLIGAIHLAKRGWLANT